MNVTRKCIMVAVLAFPVWFGSATQPIWAQGPSCHARTQLLEKLKTEFAERRVGAGINGAGALVEVLASEQGTWTIVVTRPGGQTCLVSSGFDWQIFAPPTAGETAANWNRDMQQPDMQ